MSIEKEKIVEDLDKDFDTFDEAFDALADDLASDKKDTKSVEDTSTEDTAKQEKDSLDTETETDDSTASMEEEDTNWKARAEEWEQKFRSFEGRVQAELIRRKAQEQEQQRVLELALRGAQQPQQKKDAMPKHISEFYEEFPDIATAVEDIIQLRLQGAQKYVDEVVDRKVNPFINDFQMHKTNTHLGRILDRHPDAVRLMEDGSLMTWTEKLPIHAQMGAKTILNAGTSDEVIKLLDQYKEETNKKEKVKTTPTNDAVARKSNDLAKEVKAGLVVKGAQSTIKTDTTANIQDDFDKGWEEALKALKVV